MHLNLLNNFYFQNHFLHSGSKYSASKIIYIETVEQSEIGSEIVDFVIAKCIPVAFMLPKPILSYFKYFTTDAGPDAFELTFPLW